MSFYLIEFSNKDNGWITKLENKSYKYTKIRNSPTHSTIEEAEQWIEEYDKNRPWIDHKIGNHKGKLFPLEEWKESCDEGCFIDYDGYGTPVDENYLFIGGVIKPSDYTVRNGKNIPIDTRYILWYNR